MKKDTRLRWIGHGIFLCLLLLALSTKFYYFIFIGLIMTLCIWTIDSLTRIRKVIKNVPT